VALVACALVWALPGRAVAVECAQDPYLVTAFDPLGREASTEVCALEELARWLHLTPASTISPTTPEVDLGPLFVVELAESQSSGARRLVQLRLYPKAPEAPMVFVAEPGYIETESYTGHVSQGWRVLEPVAQVPAALVAAGVPQTEVASTVGGDPGSRGRTATGPDAVSVVFIGLLIAVTAAALSRRRVVARGRPDL
jgi:hypothetical protein